MGLHIGPSEAEIFWSTFLKSLVRRGLRGTRLVISDAHEGLKAAIRRVLGSTWQRCRVHWMRNAQAYVSKGQQNMVSAALRQAFTRLDHQNATQTMRHVADQLRDKWPKLGAFIDDSEADVLAFMNFPAPAPGEDPFDQPDRAVEQRGQTPRRYRRHLSQRGRHHRADRRGTVGGQRRMAASEPLHADGGHGRTHTNNHRRRGYRDRHHSCLTNRHLKPHHSLHHLDGRDRSRSGAKRPHAGKLIADDPVFHTD